jgi:hypothetical protein
MPKVIRQPFPQKYPSLAGYWFSPFSDTGNENFVAETVWILGAIPPARKPEKGGLRAPVGSFPPPHLKTLLELL